MRMFTFHTQKFGLANEFSQKIHILRWFRRSYVETIALFRQMLTVMTMTDGCVKKNKFIYTNKNRQKSNILTKYINKIVEPKRLNGILWWCASKFVSITSISFEYVNIANAPHTTYYVALNNWPFLSLSHKSFNFLADTNHRLPAIFTILQDIICILINSS